MKIEKLHLDGKKSSIEVLDKIFSAKVNNKLVSSVLYKTNANYKGRYAKTKQQNEVSGPTSKIYAQKGTGNARHASKKAPIFVGGGVAHGPKGAAYKIKKINKKVRKLALAQTLSKYDDDAGDWYVALGWEDKRAIVKMDSVLAKITEIKEI